MGPLILTARRKQIMQLVCDGLTNPEIAKSLHRSPDTIRQTLHIVYEQLGATNRAQAAAIFTKQQMEEYTMPRTKINTTWLNLLPNYWEHRPEVMQPYTAHIKSQKFTFVTNGWFMVALKNVSDEMFQPYATAFTSPVKKEGVESMLTYETDTVGVVEFDRLKKWAGKNQITQCKVECILADDPDYVCGGPCGRSRFDQGKILGEWLNRVQLAFAFHYLEANVVRVFKMPLDNDQEKENKREPIVFDTDQWRVILMPRTEPIKGQHTNEFTDWFDVDEPETETHHTQAPVEHAPC